MLAACLLGSGVAAQPAATLRVTAAAQLLTGQPLAWRVTGLAPGELVRLHALRLGARAVTVEGADQQQAVLAHAWVQVRADTRGDIDAARALPISGTYSGIDGLGLLWSGLPVHADGQQAAAADVPRPAALGKLPQRREEVRLALQRAGGMAWRGAVLLRAHGDGVQWRELHGSDAADATPAQRISGVLAAPAGARGGPTLILLHGSEGADGAAARAWAGRMAEEGYTALALHYVRYAWSGAWPGVATAFANLPLELLDAARQRLAQQPEADVQRVALVGASKGAELALLAASRYTWVRAVVACVPSDLVWAGFGRALAPGETTLSSWSWAGQPLAAVSYDRYEDVFSGAATARQVHERSRAAATAALVEAAAIPIERIRAPVLLIGGGRDEVWPSATMSAALAQRATAAGHPQVQLVNFGEAGHGICGNGSRLARMDEAQAGPVAATAAATAPATAPATAAATAAAPGVQATAQASAQAFRLSLSFLRAAL